MNYNEVLTLYFERSREMQTFWTFYLSVCVIMPLLVAFMRASRRRLVVAAILSFAFAVITAVNLSAVIDITHERLGCKDLIHGGSLPGTPPQPIKARIEAGINPPGVPAVIAVQIGGDLLALATLWYLVLARRDSL